MPFTPRSHTGGVLHHIASRLVAYEHGKDVDGDRQSRRPQNFVLFLGGMGDSILSVNYPTALAEKLPPQWTVVEVELSSVRDGWTIGSLVQDCQELAQVTAFFKTLSTARLGASPAATNQDGGQIYLLGHSTGAQVAASYVIGPWKEPQISAEVRARPQVTGIILQSGVSDREGLRVEMKESEFVSALSLAKEWEKDGRELDHLPQQALGGFYDGRTTPTAQRWISITDEQGDDDLFSADLSRERDDRVWGSRGLASREVPVLVLLSENDECMPQNTNKDALLRKWAAAVQNNGGIWSSNSGVVPKASHNLNRSSPSAVDDLCRRIVSFVSDGGNSPTHKRRSSGL